MGTTIRRQPVSFDIPKAPDYKFLNITNFGGIEKSSNPFVVSANTASDCLNVYVDEDNALTTRPRVSPTEYRDFLYGRLNTIEFIGVYPIRDGAIHHYKYRPIYVDAQYERVDVTSQTSGTFYMLPIDPIDAPDELLSYEVELPQDYVDEIVIMEVEYVDSKQRTNMARFTNTPLRITYGNSPKYVKNLPVTKCTVFNNQAEIYLLDGVNYYKISRDPERFRPTDLTIVDGYVPTTRVGKNKVIKTIKDDATGKIQYEIDSEGTVYEPMNILSDKYKETYFWDGVANPSSFKDSDSDVVENNYVTHSVTLLQGDDYYLTSLELLAYAKQASKLSDKYNYYLGYHMYDNTLSVRTTTKSHEYISSSDVFVTTLQASYSDYIIAFSSSGKTVALADSYGDNTITTYTRSNLSDSFEKSTITVGDNDGPIKKILLNSDGDRLCCISADDKLYMYWKGTSWSRVYTPKMNNIEDVEDVTINSDGTTIVSLGKLNGVYTIIKSEIPYISVDLTDVELPKFWSQNEYPSSGTLQLSNDGKQLVLAVRLTLNDGKYTWVRDELRYISDVTKDSPTALLLDAQRPWMSFASDNVFRFSDENRKVYFKTHKDQGFFITNNPTNVIFDIQYPVLAMPEVDTSDNSISGLMGYAIKTDTLALDSSEPLLTITKTLDTKDSDVLRTNLLSSTMFTRFDNNIWFASGNYTFHTEYNDPTYVPVSSYNTLGEDYEEITGLSIVNDNILAAYKRNKIYIITPVTVGDSITYSYTETKNVIGNDAVGAPILTILTEMPTIVSYDGIYALNQLENVQSGDRITTLISEAINPKWLKESKADIDGCITLNRLYWTYYILPHRKTEDEHKDYTKVYLLDNRSQQWYYWELPIYVTAAHVYTNKQIDRLYQNGVVHIWDESFNAYKLITNDIVTDTDTEYYDTVLSRRLPYENAYAEEFYVGKVDTQNNKNKKLIPWHWYSQILSLNTMNYTKRLVDTTFVLTDTDSSDGYRLKYRLKAWRKTVSETDNGSEITGNVHYVQSTTKRTAIPRFSFIQFKLDNYEDDVNNNKLRLVGLGLKYVLLEGLY